jgi:[protein-PII] uridylyltransferase
VLVRQEQRPVADALGLADEDALLREVSLAGRRLAFVADETWRRVEAALVRRPRGRYRRVRREPLAEGVVRQGDEVVLARDARPAADPGLLLRAAAAAARADLLLSPYTLKVLAVHSPPLPEPWPAEVRWSFLRLLASGRPPSPSSSSWTRRGCCPGCCPSGTGCARCRSATRGTGSPSTGTWSRPPRPPPSSPTTSTGPTCCWSARCCTTSARAGPATTASSASRSRPRSPPGWASPPADVATLAALVRHHLLLPDTATRRDIDDPATIDRVAATIGHDPAVLQLLHALAQADGAATSASAWSPWKAHLVAALVARVQARLGAGPCRSRSRCCTPPSRR